MGGAAIGVAIGAVTATTLTAPPAQAVAPVTVVFYNGAGVEMTGCIAPFAGPDDLKQCVYGVPPKGSKEVSTEIHRAPGVDPAGTTIAYLTGVTGVAKSNADHTEYDVRAGQRIACQYTGGAINSGLDCYPV